MAYWDTPGRSDDWFAPKYIFDALGCEFDMDVAAPKDGPLHVPCREWLSEKSLTVPWRGFVFMNAPFGERNGLTPWLNRFIEHRNGIALTPDRTSAPWFWAAWGRADMVLFLRKVRFLRPDGSEGKSPSNGTALWAVGDKGCAALVRAASAGLGILAHPVKS